MIDISDALRVHEVLMEKYGGSAGVRDKPALSSALQRPFQTFDGIDV